MARSDLIDQLKSQIAAIEGDAANRHRPHRFRDDGASHTVSYREPPVEEQTIDTHAQASTPAQASDSSEESRAFRKIAELVNISDRSEKSLRERLAKHGFSDTAIDSAVERTRTCGFVDDERFARVLIRSRISQGKGSAGIERELKSHDIDPFLVEGWPHDYDIDFDSELSRALDLLEKRPPHSKNPRESAFRRLVSKGYPSGVASSASRIWFEQFHTP